MKDKNNFLEKVNHNSEAFFTMHSGLEKSFPIHCHNKHQLYYLEGGIAFFNTHSKSFFVPAHHFLWIPAGIEHNIRERTNVKRIYNIFIPVSLMKNNLKLEQNAGIFPVTTLLREMIYYTDTWNGEISPKQTTKFQFLLALKNIISEVANTPLPIELPTTSNQDLSEILKYIHHHIESHLTLDIIAQEFGYSTRSLSRLFQKNISTSFLQYVKLTRIIKAMELLLQTDLPVTEVAFKCGYSNLSSFSYAFQKIAHSSPAEFRKNNQN